MNTEAQAADQVIHIALEGAEVALRLTGSAVKNALPLIMALLQGEKTAGKTRLMNLLKNSRDVQITDIKFDDYKQFKKEADTMQILYTPIKDEAADKVWILTGTEELGRLNHVRQKMGYGTIDLSEYAKKNESRDTQQQNYSPEQEKSSVTKNKNEGEPIVTPPPEKWKALTAGKETAQKKESVAAKLEGHKQALAKQAAKAPVKQRTASKGRG